MQWGNGNCPSQEQHTDSHAPASQKKPHHLGWPLDTQRNSKHQNSLSLLAFQAKQQWEPTKNRPHCLSSENQKGSYPAWNTSLYTDYFTSLHTHQSSTGMLKSSMSHHDFYVMDLFKYQLLPLWLWKSFAKVNRSNTPCQGSTLIWLTQHTPSEVDLAYWYQAGSGSLPNRLRFSFLYLGRKCLHAFSLTGIGRQ